jgi:hypothetical protein
MYSAMAHPQSADNPRVGIRSLSFSASKVSMRVRSFAKTAATLAASNF